MKANDYRQKETKLLKEARELHDTADSEDREVTAEESEKFDRIMADADKAKEQYARLDKLESRELSLGDSQGRVSQPQQPAVELPKEAKQRYSLLRAVSTLASGKPLDGIEKECSDEIAHQTGRDPQGFFMPHTFETYDFDSTAATGAIGTVLDPSNFIDLLRNKMVVQQAGARVISDLQGDFAMPRQSGGASSFWVAEAVGKQ